MSSDEVKATSISLTTGEVCSGQPHTGLSISIGRVNREEDRQRELEHKKRSEEQIERIAAIRAVHEIEKILTREAYANSLLFEERNRAVARANTLEGRLRVLIKMVVVAKNIDKLEKETMLAFIDSWRDEDAQLEMDTVNAIRNIGMNYPK